MARLALLAAGAVVGALAAAPGRPPRYLDEWECIFHRGLDSQGVSLWSWDLYGLRKSSYNEYSIEYDAANRPGALFTFNLCGTIREACAPYDAMINKNILPPLTRGIAIQYIDNNSPMPGSALCKDTNTCDIAVDPTCVADTVQLINCTANCEVIAPYIGAAPVFTLWDESKPAGGITLSYQGALPYLTDPFGACEVDPRTGYPVERSFTINLACDPKAPATDLINMVYSEPSQCQYVVNATTSAACPKAGDPFDKNDATENRDGKNFGYVVLGWLVCAPISYIIFLFLDNKGYLDPIKSRLPALPFSLDFLSSRGGVYGSGSYKGVSATAPSSGSVGTYGAT